MRPKILEPLYYNIQNISGIGPYYTSLIKNLVGDRYKDILLHMPTSSIKRKIINNVLESQINQKIIFTGIITSTWTTYKKPRMSIATVKFKETNISIIYFNVKKIWFEGLFKKGNELAISGTLQKRNSKYQIVHPDYVENNIKTRIPLFETLYPLTKGLNKNKLSSVIQKVINVLPSFEEWIDLKLIKSKKWPKFDEAIKSIHFPRNQKSLDQYPIFLERLAYDEALSRQLALNLIRVHKRKKIKKAKNSKAFLRKKLSSLLPFKLTKSQNNVLLDIYKDLNSNEKMSRLIQGDVGSGKTIVAFFSLLYVVESGYQGALMVPTEILSQQHYNFFKKYSDGLGIKIELLIGKEKNLKKQKILSKVSNGLVDIIIGTHAIIQKNVKFKNLGLVVIDEQHRFGVYQRLALLQKSPDADFMVMTATPIPRTLILTNYGDMDLSIMNEKPLNRPLIKTITVNNNKINDVISSISNSLKNGEQVFWVCPLVQESENIDLIAVETRAKSLNNYFPNQISIIHGKMSYEEKENNLNQFIKSQKPILVSTTVIEVGIDIPKANIMIIEHAERFGLSQLHQLRGRIGRGMKDSICILLYDKKLSNVAKNRLTTMKNTNDGFLISEKDLELRGPGELLGTRQSGEQSFRILDLNTHKDLVEIANNEAKLISNKNPKLLGSQGSALKNLLYLFDQDKAVELIKIG